MLLTRESRSAVLLFSVSGSFIIGKSFLVKTRRFGDRFIHKNCAQGGGRKTFLMYFRGISLREKALFSLMLTDLGSLNENFPSFRHKTPGSCAQGSGAFAQFMHRVYTGGEGFFRDLSVICLVKNSSSCLSCREFLPELQDTGRARAPSRGRLVPGGGVLAREPGDWPSQSAGGGRWPAGKGSRTWRGDGVMALG